MAALLTLTPVLVIEVNITVKSITVKSI